MQRYKVTEQYGSGKDAPIATFKKDSDAKVFVDAKLAVLSSSETIIYRIFDLDELVSEHKPGSVDATSTSASSQGSQGQSSSSSFRPTPFNTTPTPTGLPKKWLNDDEDEKKK
jgi:hypothetical protein